MVDSSIVFTAALSPGSSGTSALLLAESIRAKAGSLSKTAIKMYVTPDAEALPKRVVEKLRSLDVDLLSYEVDAEATRFFFVPEATAAAQAERDADGEAETMAWLGTNSLIVREPKAFKLPAAKSLGYRPVHIINVGSRIDSPLDDFWTQINKSCGVKPGSTFPMRTHIDGNTIRPYFNAGHLVVHPERGLLRAWSVAFLRLYRASEYQRFFDEDRYRIFMHQAVLSALMLSKVHRSEMVELPLTYNYPIHLYGEDKTGNRPASIDDLVTVRHEGFWEDPDWFDKMPASQQLKMWLAEKLVT